MQISPGTKSSSLPKSGKHVEIFNLLTIKIKKPPLFFYKRKKNIIIGQCMDKKSISLICLKLHLLITRSKPVICTDRIKRNTRQS